MSLLPSVICDCVGLDRYTTAFGILFLFRGVTSIIGPPAAGFLKDYTKKYDLAFAIGGAMIIIAAFFHMSLACFEPEYEEEKEKEKEVDV
jgi:MFS-type transporter involved in bile tolerance (Atg22 family)